MSHANLRYRIAGTSRWTDVRICITEQKVYGDTPNQDPICTEWEWLSGRAAHLRIDSKIPPELPYDLECRDAILNASNSRVYLQTGELDTVYASAYEFDFVLSHAGTIRHIVKPLKTGLEQRGCKVFYDKDYSHLFPDPTDKDPDKLYQAEYGIYRQKGIYRIIVLSKHYYDKCRQYTCFEEQQILSVTSRQMQLKNVILIKTDDAELHGILFDEDELAGQFDVNKMSNEEICNRCVEILLEGPHSSMPC